MLPALGTGSAERQRSTLAALLGTSETLAGARHELIVALVDDPRRLQDVDDDRLAAMSHAAQALDRAIVAALREASEDRAALIEQVAELARRGVEGRLLEEGCS